MVETQDYKAELIATAKAIVRPGFGILAADESTGTIGNRFSGINVENTEENRRFYRELLFTTPGFENHISGVIMYDETLHQKAACGTNFVELLKSKNVIPGIKVDTGVVELMGTNHENATQGLDGLGKRCAAYYAQGCRFAKWRAVCKIDAANGMPTQLSCMETAHTLARYATICQQNGLVPIVEPEIMTDGPHDINVCAAASEKVFGTVMKALMDHHVILEGMLLKPNMITPGSTCATPADHATIAWLTVRTLRRTMVPAIPGIVFLSGGQSEEHASQNLSAMNKIDSHMRPWALSFSYGRALQSSTLKAWAGKAENKEAAQKVFLHRCLGNGDATLGKYGGGGDATGLHVANYTY
jgi:fructose-bisphosphate aldolase class I